jgi:hypothetical protein
MVVTIIHRLEGSPDVSGLPNPFTDVPAGQWYTNAVIWAAANDIVGGYGGGRFGPEDYVTRQDLAVLLNRYSRYAGIDVPVIRAYTGFNDEADIAGYAKEAVERFFEGGIISGRPGNVFDPRGNATRAELAAMLARFMQTAESE